MKYCFMARAFGHILDGFLKDSVDDRGIAKKVRAEYKAIVIRSKDIGTKNRLLTSYVFAAYFIAMARNTGLTPEQNLEIMERGLAGSRVVKMFMGDADSYFSERSMDSRRAWAEESHLRRYENDWELDIVEIPGGFGMDYTRCGVCALCRDEGCPELARYMCRLDFMRSLMCSDWVRRYLSLSKPSAIGFPIASGD